MTVDSELIFALAEESRGWLWIPTTAPWRMGWLLARTRGCFRVVPDVHEELCGGLGHLDAVEELAGAQLAGAR